MHPDQAQNTLSGVQGQEATAVAVIYFTVPPKFTQNNRIQMKNHSESTTKNMHLSASETPGLR